MKTYSKYDPDLSEALEAFRQSGFAASMTLDRVQGLRDFSKGFEIRESDYPDLEFHTFVAASEFDDHEVELLMLKSSKDLLLGNADPCPVVFYIHGGGMVSGSNRVALDAAIAWVRELPIVLVSVEYRLAPEHPHPTPIHDCFSGLRWVQAHAESLKIDPSRVLIAGTSAGGGLAAALTLMARDNGVEGIVGQLLIAPMLDDRTTVSGHQDGISDGSPWDIVSNTTGWEALLGDAMRGDSVSPYAAPAREFDYTRLPPTYLDVGSAELFRDEVAAFASEIWRSGGEAELHVWRGAFHGFDDVAPSAAVSNQARTARTMWLKRTLAVSAEPTTSASPN